MKKQITKLLWITMLFMTLSCQDEPIIPVDPTPSDTVLSGVINENIKLTSDHIWELSGRVIINDGVTITIEPGTIIKGREGQGVNASALIISRGGKIEAIGTEEEPIIFTSILDNIKVNEKFGTNLTKTDNSKWGGLIILGNAPISAGDGDTESTIEGLPANELYGKYGGSVIDDNSGILEYVSIRHGGTLIGEGNEINGLTLGGVGSGTVVENVEVFATLDDGIELFGGTVNVKNFISTWQGDDGVDIDQNYSGTVDNFVVAHGDLVGTDEGLEIDGPEGTTYINGMFLLKNGTCMSDNIDGSAADFKSKAQGTVENVIFSNYNGGSVIKIAASYKDDCLNSKTDAFTNLTDTPAKLIFNGCKFDSNEVYTKSKASDGTTTCTVSSTDQTAADEKLISDPSASGADVSVFSWTISKSVGVL
jgi:hypothetical protein